MLLGLSFGVILSGLAAYNLYDTFVAEHEVNADFMSSSSAAASSTSASSSTVVSSTSTSSTSTSSTSSGTATSSAASSSTTGESPYSTTTAELLKKTATNSNGVTSKYYLVDVKLHSFDDLKTHMVTSSKGAPGTNYKATVANHVSAIESAGETPIAVINGDSAYYSAYRQGYVIRNGLQYRSTYQTLTGQYGVTSGDDFAIYQNGTAKAFVEKDVAISDLMSQSCYHCFCFGPTLLENSTIQVSEDQDVFQCKGANQRTAIGYVDAYHFVLFVSEGRINNSDVDGFSLYEVGGLLKDFGCTLAYNLDGGGASYLWYQGSRINSSSENRSVGDVIYVTAS